MSIPYFIACLFVAPTSSTLGIEPKNEDTDKFIHINVLLDAYVKVKIHEFNKLNIT